MLGDIDIFGRIFLLEDLFEVFRGKIRKVNIFLKIYVGLNRIVVKDFVWYFLGIFEVFYFFYCCNL